MKLGADFEIRNNAAVILALTSVLNSDGYGVNIVPKGDKVQVIITDWRDER